MKREEFDSIMIPFLKLKWSDPKEILSLYWRVLMEFDLESLKEVRLEYASSEINLFKDFPSPAAIKFRILELKMAKEIPAKELPREVDLNSKERKRFFDIIKKIKSENKSKPGLARAIGKIEEGLGINGTSKNNT